MHVTVTSQNGGRLLLSRASPDFEISLLELYLCLTQDSIFNTQFRQHAAVDSSIPSLTIRVCWFKVLQQPLPISGPVEAQAPLATPPLATYPVANKEFDAHFCLVDSIFATLRSLVITMEALAAIGLIGNVITFVDSGAKLLETLKEIKSSTAGSTARDADLEAIANDVREQVTNIALKKPTAPVDSFEIGLLDRANECIHLSAELHQLIQDLKPSKPGSKRETIKAVYRNYVKRNEKESLAQKLAECRAKLEAQLRTAERYACERILCEI